MREITVPVRIDISILITINDDGSITTRNVSNEVIISDVSIKDDENLTYKCYMCAYKSPTYRGLSMHLLKGHTEKFKNVEKKKIVKKQIKKKKKYIKKPLSFGTKANFPQRQVELKSKIVNCSNDRCSGRDRFVQGTGIVYENKEYCNYRCLQDWKERLS